MDRQRALLALAGLSALLCGCETLQPTGKSSVAYNRSFADARNEMLVLNVLRASERQPLLFSTIGSVSGGLRSGMSLKLPFTNILLGGDEAINPELTFSNRNPTVTINPLTTKEFVKGMATRVDPTTIDEFLAQGWPKEIVLSLAVGGVLCPGSPERVVINTGSDSDVNRRFLEMFRSGEFAVVEPEPVHHTTLRMSGKDAAALLKDGLKGNLFIASVEPSKRKGAPADEVTVVISKGKDPVIEGLDYGLVCSAATTSPAMAKAARSSANFVAGESSGDSQVQPGLLMRSVQGMFLYLGQVVRPSGAAEACDNGGQDASGGLFFLRRTCREDAVPLHNVVSTTFLGRRYYIPAAGLAGEDDHTLTTLSLLSEMIALQTNEAATRPAVPVVTIAQ